MMLPLHQGLSSLDGEWELDMLRFRWLRWNRSMSAARAWAATRLKQEPDTPDRCWRHGRRGDRVASRRWLLRCALMAAEYLPPPPSHFTPS